MAGIGGQDDAEETICIIKFLEGMSQRHETPTGWLAERSFDEIKNFCLPFNFIDELDQDASQSMRMSDRFGFCHEIDDPLN